MSRAINKVVVALLTLMLMFIGINTASAHSTDADNSGCPDVTVTLDGETHVFTWADIEHAARLSNVDPLELKQAIEKGPDEEGKFSPFSYLSPLDNGLTREDLSELDKQKNPPQEYP